MKKLLFITFTALFVANIAAADSIADQFNDFITMEKGHKDDWFNVKINDETAKMNLIKKQHDAWADFKKELVTDWGNGKKLSQGHLLKAINLHKAQKAEWKKWNDQSQNAMADTAKKHDDALAKFIKNMDKENLQKDKASSNVPPPPVVDVPSED